MPKVTTQSSSVVDLDVEESIGMAGEKGKVVSIQKRQQGGTRRSYEDAPLCPHCQGRLHMNLAAATINFECLWRQFCMASGRMEKPEERLPVFTVTDIEPLNEWAASRARSRKSPLGYGKMTVEGAPPATYAGVKVASKKSEDDDGDVKKLAKKSAREVMKQPVAPVAPTKSKKTKAAPEPEPVKPIKSKKSSGAAKVSDIKRKPVKSTPPASFNINEMELDVEPVAAPRKRTTPPPAKSGKTGKRRTA